MAVFITGNVPSSKNSNQMAQFKDKRGKTHKVLTKSKTVKKYLREKGVKSYSTRLQTVETYKTIRNTFKSEIEPILSEFKGKKKPFKIGLYFVRDSRRKFDYHNVCQIVLDLMTAHKIIDDDNADEVIPVFTGYEVDKNNAGVKIEIL